MKNLKKNTILIFLITLLVLFFLLKDDFKNIMNQLVNVNLFWLLIAIVSFSLYILCKAESLRIVAVKNNQTFTYKQSLLQNLIVHFFNGITPFQTGGQPMQIYMLKKGNMSISKATNVVIQEFIFYQIALVLLGLIAVIINYFCHFFSKVHFLQVLVICGFLFNVLVVVLLLILCFSKKTTEFLVKGITKLLGKLKIVKNKKEALEKVDQKLKDFHTNAKFLLLNKKMLTKGVLVNFVGLCFFYVTPFFLAYGMGITHLNIIEVITASAYVYLVGSFVPLPGASGGLEYSFMRFFGNFISGSVLPALLIIFRTITYYLPVLIGALVFNFYKGDEQE